MHVSFWRTTKVRNERPKDFPKVEPLLTFGITVWTDGMVGESNFVSLTSGIHNKVWKIKKKKHKKWARNGIFQQQYSDHYKAQISFAMITIYLIKDHKQVFQCLFNVVKGLFTWYRNDFHSRISSFHLHIFLCIRLHDTKTKFRSRTSHSGMSSFLLSFRMKFSFWLTFHSGIM